MAICPRRRSGAILRHEDDGEKVGAVELNGCLLAGTAMVKTREEWAFLKGDEGRLDRVLRDVGFPGGEAEVEDGGGGRRGGRGERSGNGVEVEGQRVGTRSGKGMKETKI